MTATARTTANADALLSSAAAFEVAERPDEALAQAWHALDLAPEDSRAKRLVTRLLHGNPELASEQRRTDLERLLCDPDVDPDSISSAGWKLLLKRRVLAPGGDPKAMATSLEKESLALVLLTEACVLVLDAELALKEVRRWLLLSSQWPHYPRLAEALAAQAAHSGGAWPFDADERAALEQFPASPFTAAYLPPHQPPLPGERFDDPVTQAVSDQYVQWPFPVWSRRPAPEPTTVPRHVEELDAGRPCGLPVQAEVLIAGCGTGSEAVQLARRFPDAGVTAIDISAASLAYAANRCAGLDVDFRLLDLHQAASLGRRFDLITCCGVLHHLPDPEAGWAKLVEVLNPDGVMKVMVYSRVARLGVEAAKTYIADLRDQPVDDDLLRAVRRRLIEKAPAYVAGFTDFYSLGGVHDLLLHRHEDPFDVPRIVRALDSLGLELLAFKLPGAADEARYRAENPNDPLFRDVDAWGKLEKTRPFLFVGMYSFWCRRKT
jgi:SAM-dependent methyltransferase